MSSSEKNNYGPTDEFDKLKDLIDQSLVGIYIYQDGFLPYVNLKAAKTLGYTEEELSAMPVTDIIAEDDYALCAEHIRKLTEGEINDVHTYIRVKRKDDSIIEIEVQGILTMFNGMPAIMGTFLDITERRKKEAEIQSAQKLESLSAFASGIALEYNNILTALIGNLALAKMYTKPGYEVYDVLIEAEKASLRAKDLTSQLLSFAKGGPLVKKIIFLQELIRELISISFDSKSVIWEIMLPDNLWPVMADESQIGQAIITLLGSARQATPLGKTIRISGENAQIGSSASFPIREGRYVVLSIEDQGEGIPEEKLQTFFDPFHAAENKAGALGLASSFNIIRKHEGHITAESRIGSGTTFHIYIPAAGERSPVTEGTFMTSRRKGKILIMDDEEIVRVVVTRLLLQCGFEAELAREGEEMLRLYREAKEAGRPFEAVILDLIIQEGMGGQEAIKHLLAYDPHVKVIVSSGYSHDPIMTNFREYGFTSFLPKPYKLEELRRVLTEVVAGEP
jgi:two-component system, cell cycle sensor histidine kinase and response regulator CckA